MSLEALKTAKKAIGAKQTIRAIEKGIVVTVYLADDADSRITQPIRELCKGKNITVMTMTTMSELGRACGIEVGAAAVAVTK